ncbi:MAG: hypothetical protein OXF68_05670 [Gammaproteobacteria bacterium]|nr:hypothetical protein [Gammaproteobacteria bacterium]
MNPQSSKIETRTDDEWVADGWEFFELPDPPPTLRDIEQWATRETLESTGLTALLEKHWPKTLWVTGPYQSDDNDPTTIKNRLCVILFTEDNAIGFDIRTAYSEYTSKFKTPLKELFTAYYQWNNASKLEPGDGALIPKPTALVRSNHGNLIIDGVRNDLEDQTRLIQMLDREPGDDRVALLEVMDLATSKILVHKNKVVPFELRLFVHILACVPRHTLAGGHQQVIATFRELLRLVGKVQDGKLNWNSTRDRPLMKHAVERLKNLGLPIMVRGRPHLWFPISVKQMPVDWGLEDEIRLNIDWPEQSANGPEVDMEKMISLSTSRAPQWRSYIAASSWTWEPGITRVPKGAPRKGQPQQYGYALDESRWPIHTLERLRELAFTAGDRRNRSESQILAPWNALDDFEVIKAKDRRKGVEGYRVIPKAAREKMAQRLLEGRTKI